MVTEFHLLSNRRPHCFVASFSKPFEDITIKDVLDAAYRAQIKQADEEDELVIRDQKAYRVQRENLQLREISDKNAVFTLPSPSPDSKLLRREGLAWYGIHGWYLSSKPMGEVGLDEQTKLHCVGLEESRACDVTKVRLYVVDSAPSIPPDTMTIVAERTQYINHVAKDSESSITPSIVAKSLSTYCAVQRSEAPVVDGRIKAGPPSALYDPAFAYATRAFRDGLKQVELERNDNPRAQDFDVVKFAYKFGKTLNRTHDPYSEKQKPFNDRIAEDLSTLLDDPHLITRENTHGPDVNGKLRTQPRDIIGYGYCGTAHCRCHERPLRSGGTKGDCRCHATYFLAVVKLSPQDDSDPNVQCSFAYRQRVAASAYDAILATTCCPCLLAAIAGNMVRFFAAYFTDMVYVEALGPPMTFLEFDMSNYMEWAKHLQVIRNTARLLRESYLKVHTGDVISHLPHLFPRPFHIAIDYNRELASQLLNLVIAKRLPKTHPRHGIFQGFLNGQTRVIVKFVGDYGADVQNYLARYQRQKDGKDEDYPLAPTLRFCETLITGLKIVVMDFVDGTHLSADHSSEALADVDMAVQALRDGHYVHGDLRPPNIIVQNKKRAYIIDFDLAGEHGTVRYPLDLNPSPSAGWFFTDVKARRGTVVGKDDDLLMVEEIRRHFQSNGKEKVQGGGGA